MAANGLRGLLGRLVARLPRDRDRDVAEMLMAEDGKRIGQRAVAYLFGVTQPAVAAMLRAVRCRLVIIGRDPDLQLPEAAGRTVQVALRERGFLPGEARYLWELYWTSSPSEALRRSRLQSPGDALQRLLKRSYRLSNLQQLQRGLRRLGKLPSGCLWGRVGKTTKKLPQMGAKTATKKRPQKGGKKGTKKGVKVAARGNRFVEGPEVIRTKTVGKRIVEGVEVTEERTTRRRVKRLRRPRH